MKIKFFMTLMVSFIILTGCASIPKESESTHPKYEIADASVIPPDACNGRKWCNSDSSQVKEGGIETKYSIDEAYLKIKKALHFLTEEEYIASFNGNEKIAIREIKNTGFSHESNPGAFYTMSKAYDDGQVFVSVLIENRDSGSMVFYTITARDMKLINNYKNILIKAVK